MKPSLITTYTGELYIRDQVNNLFALREPEQREYLCSSLNTPLLHEFGVESSSGKSEVYRTHEEIQQFIDKYNQMYADDPQYKKLVFDRMKQSQYLSHISQLNGIQFQSWYKKFFNIQTTLPHKKFSISLKKQSGGRYFQRQCCFCIKWKKCKAFVLKDGIVTYNESKDKIQEFLAFGKDFRWQPSMDIKQLKIYIHSYHRKLSLKAQSALQLIRFTYAMQKYMNRYKKQQYLYRFNSFGPVRENNDVEFYIDGADYFEAVAHQIQRAHQQVFICGWWVSPQFMLKRDGTGKSIEYRLDKLLSRVANRGVKIYVIIYLESSFLTNDSAYTKQTLQSLHSNIKVLRHPQIVLPTFWSHHEKLIVVDQNLAFLGGLDLCYGRYDTQEHALFEQNTQIYPGIQYNNCRIADFTQVRRFQKQNVSRDKPRLPWHDVTLKVEGKCVKDLTRHFIQYWNYANYQSKYADRYVLVANDSRFHKKEKEKQKTDLFTKVRKMTNDIFHFSEHRPENSPRIQEHKNEQQIQTEINKKRVHFNGLSKHQKSRQAPNLDNMQTSHRKQILQLESPQGQKTMMIEEVKSEQKLSPIKQEGIFINLGIRDESNNGSSHANMVNDSDTKSSQRQARLGQEALRDEIAQIQQRNFQIEEKKRIQRTQKEAQIKINKMVKVQQQIEYYEAEQNLREFDYIYQKQEQQYLKQLQLKKPNRLSQKISQKFDFLTRIGQDLKRKNPFSRKNTIDDHIQDQHKKESQKKEPNYYFSCQALRSASQWSIGCVSKNYETSIYDAYIEKISTAKKFIYIENQFFISATIKGGVVKNRIMQAIYQKIQKSIQANQDFKVMVMMPLIPGFAGQLDDSNASLPRVIMNWQFRTICKGQNSLLGRLAKITDNPHKYVQFYGLRTHGQNHKNIPFTEIIYLHSKLIIIDDRCLICGSANINDRSMLGNRDSQLALIVQGKSPTEKLNKIRDLRVKLWQQHFGISELEADDPMKPGLWQKLSDIADNNTQIYKQIFGCYPDDQAKRLTDIKKIRKTNPNSEQYSQKIHKIRGHAVKIPLKFLENEKLTSYHPNQIST